MGRWFYQFNYRNSLLQGHSKRYSVGFRLSEQKSSVSSDNNDPLVVEEPERIK